MTTERQSLLRSALATCLPLLSGAAALAQTARHPEPRGFSCQGDEKVWVNTRSGVYHPAGERYYGSTKQGKYLCKKAADAEGDRETRNGQ